MEVLVCDVCGEQYSDKPSIEMAKREAETWAQLCREASIEPRGLVGCPKITCKGEMILRTIP